MEPLKAAVIGTGFIGKQHIEAINRMTGVKVVAVADRDEALASSVGERMGVPQSFTDYKELLMAADIQVVHVCTTNALHYEICKAAIECGKHVYCEKPLTIFQQEAEELCNLAKEKDVAAGADFNYRHNVMVREMRERVKHQTISCLRVLPI